MIKRGRKGGEQNWVWGRAVRKLLRHTREALIRGAVARVEKEAVVVVAAAAAAVVAATGRTGERANGRTGERGERPGGEMRVTPDGMDSSAECKPHRAQGALDRESSIAYITGKTNQHHLLH